MLRFLDWLSSSLEKESNENQGLLHWLAQNASAKWVANKQTIVDNINLEPYEWNDEFVRWTVLDLLKVMNQSTLAKLCPLPQSMISNIVNSKYSSSLSSDKLRAFGTWYKDFKAGHQYNMPQSQGEQKDNIRVTFHPNVEVPKLKAWYNEHPLPSQNLLAMYAKDLNSSLVRWERPKIEIKHLKQWWANQKQKLKREEKEQCSGESEQENVKQSKRYIGASPNSKRQKKVPDNQNIENEVRRVEGQGVVCEINISQGPSSDRIVDVKSQIGDKVCGNFTQNISRDSFSNSYVSVTSFPERRIDNHGLFISPVSHSSVMSASVDTDQTDQFQHSNRSLGSSRILDKGPGYQYLGESHARGVNSQGDPNYQPL